MEYFHRVLQELKDNHNYKFHPKNEKMKIINLYFADDIMLFVIGDIGPVKLIMEKVKEISAATGLNMSIPKSNVYFGGVDDNTQKSIKHEIGFEIGQLSFKYLGVPLDSKKLSIAMCQPLIYKMTSRLSHWSTRLLSYAGKFLLIKSVIFSIANYWMQIFPLEKKLITHIEGLCRSFLWTGKDSTSRSALIA